MILDLHSVSTALGSAVSPPPGLVGVWSTDSRTIEPGALFFALKGPNHDGHAYLDEVFAKGALAAVVNAGSADGRPGRLLFPVADTLQGLQNVAAEARRRWAGQLIAVTGSAGKTTTKEVIAALLGTALRTGKSSGNLNNHIGVPLSLLRLPVEAEAAVIEIGMNHAGEIRALAAVARPDIAVVTNSGFAHIENFESPEGVALAKRELVESLPSAGVAVLNADDERVRSFGEAHPGRTVTFGLSGQADVRAENVSFLENGVEFSVDRVAFRSSMPGRHGVRNILAGLAVARLFGIPYTSLAETVQSLVPGEMRGERFTHAGVTVLNDCYNSNPDAARAMLDVLRDIPARRRIAVLGEMLELGRWSESLHRELGGYAAGCGISVLVGIRGAARYMVEAAVNNGQEAGAAYFFETPETAGAFVASLAQPGDAILFKGSRGTRVERALERFLG